MNLESIALLRFLRSIGILVLSFGLYCASHAQSISVSMSLDSTNLSAGQSTTLRIFAQMIPSLRTNTDRIVSWYVDVLNTNGTIAAANYAAMQKTASDRDPQTSSTGVSEGSNRRGVYDTFFNLPGAGTSNRVELMSMPVNATAVGRTRFTVQSGTGAGLTADFQAFSKDLSQIYEGGEYSAAFADINVSSGSGCSPQIRFARTLSGGAPGGAFQLSFTPCAGQNHTVEFRNTIGDATVWTALPGAPHNSGSITITNNSAQRFYRIRISVP